MPEETCQLALWTPGWYELDQTLTIGERRKYWFFQSPPTDGLDDLERDFDFVFYNQLDSTTNCSVRYARITSIQHSVLGELLRVDTDGLDYIFFPADGDEIIVNAEEEPGTTYDSDLEIPDWNLLVEMTEVSEPMGELA